MNAIVLILKICFIIFLIVLSSCRTNSHQETEDDFLRIDLSKVEKRTFLNASEVISDIEYVVLETSSNCLIGEGFTMSISDNYVLTFSNNNCLLFSRKGKFIRKIGQTGNGPADYRGGVFDVKIDEKTEMVYLSNDYSEIVVYRITGQFVKKIYINELKKIVGGFTLEIEHWKDDLLCAGINITGKEQHRFIIFNLEGEIVKYFPNHILYESGASCNLYHIYCYKELLSFKQGFSDTIFRITEQFEMVPAIVFDFPGKKIPEIERYQMHADDVKYVRSIREVENYLWLTVTDIGQCLYDKKNKRLTSFERDPKFRRTIEAPMPDGTTLSRTFFLGGLRNDIDGGLPFEPRYFSHFQNNRQLVCVYHPWVLKENLTEEHFAGYKVKNQEAHNRLKNLLTDLDWEDNPVLMIATFK